VSLGTVHILVDF